MTSARFEAVDGTIAPMVRRTLLIGASALAISIAAPAVAQVKAGTTDDANAQPADATPPNGPAKPQEAKGQSQDDEETIIVTGLRASLASAQSIKMNSGQFVDSVSAVDIGKLPDLNVAEALQRISGIQITRNRGEGSQIAIRGLTQVRTEVNGRDSFGASGARALGFEDVPSELLAGVDVYKNPSAEMIEGGVGGLVNLRTRMPFDQKGFLFSATIGANHYDLIDDTRVNGSVLLSKRFDTGIGEIGVLVDLSYFEGAFRSDEIVVEPYFDRKDIPGSIGQTRSIPDGAGIGITFGDRKRKGAYGAIQWAPASNVEIYGQVFRTDYTIRTPNYSSFVTCGTNPACATSQMQPVGNFQFDGDTFVSGAFTNVGPVANNSQYHRNRGITTDYSTGFKWGASDHLKVNGDFQYIDSTSKDQSYTAFAQIDSGGFALDLSRDLPKIAFTSSSNVYDPANYYLIALMDHLEDSHAHEYAGRLDLEWDFDSDSPLQTFTAGVRYTDRSAINRSTPYNWQFLSAAWGGNTNAPNGLRLPAYAQSNPFDASFYHGEATGVVGAVPFFAWPYLINGPETFLALSQAAGPSCCGPYPRTVVQFTGNDINTQSEQTLAGYGMLRFDFGKSGGFPLDGNIGLRVVKTKNDAEGQYILTYRTAVDRVNNLTVTTPFGQKQDYTEFLPSLNLRYHITHNLQARAAVSRGLSRPPFYDLRALFNISENYKTPPTCPIGGQPTDPLCTPVLDTRTGNGGNPALKPLTTNQADVALEWYPGRSSMLYGTLFYKKVKNFETTAVYTQSFDVPGKGSQPFQVTAQLNGDQGTVKGFEVGGNTFFNFLPSPFDGFGAQANLTYVDSKAPSLISFKADGVTPLQTPLQGLSKWSYNLIGFYEKYGVTARVAYNWRNDYLDTVNGNGTGAVAIYRRPYGQVDASLSYDFNPHVSMTLDVVNLLRERKDSYQAIPGDPRTYQLEDRRVGFSIRVKT